jgi:hypothetical protein
MLIVGSITELSMMETRGTFHLALLGLLNFGLSHHTFFAAVGS